jgi:hypothetical protein
MVMKSPKLLRTWPIASVCLAALLGASCGSIEPSPTAPTPTATPAPAPAPSPSPAPAPAPIGPGKIEATITPNPVPQSNPPLSSCTLANTWQYDQKLTNTGGSTVTLSDRDNFFDGVKVSSQSALGIVLAPGASTTIATHWCSANNIEHRASTNFTGSDAANNRVNFAGPTVRLLAR